MTDKYSMLNNKQREAVFYTEGPLLILAGAGSGKTRALTHRIAYLIEEKDVAPWNILAITFTNKAAEEMKKRVEDLVDYGDSVWVATFHSTCARILRRHIGALGYDTDFTIYDTDDQKAVVKTIIKEKNLDSKDWKEKALVSYISDCKNNVITPEEEINCANSYDARIRAEVYSEYQKKLKKNNAVDFDDLLLLTVKLFRENPDILENYQNRFRYIMVDEYQDTNHVQLEFCILLAKKYKNICVVGDDDQSIYKFRGADIHNILDFENYFKGAKVIKLEQNYRSTTGILDCANAVISNNKGRKEKHLWSDLGEGAPVRLSHFMSGKDEAREIIYQVEREVEKGAKYSDYAILYRTNAQSRLFEDCCVKQNVPYRLVGGVNFYQRAEIKDLLAYLKTIESARDDVAVRRIINVPRRGIGQTTIDKIAEFALKNDLGLFDALCCADKIPGIERGVKKVQAFTHLIGELREKAGLKGSRIKMDEYGAGTSLEEERMPIDGIIKEIIAKTEYYSTLDEFDDEQKEQKKENIGELISKAKDFEDNAEDENGATLTSFLEEVALVADVDSMDNSEDRIVLMTLHSSKGLEFPNVFLTGLEEGMFPSYMSIYNTDPMEIEEERRLCYVGITRAMRHLTLTYADSRYINGSESYNKVSRFVEEIPEDYLEIPNTYKGYVNGRYLSPQNGRSYSEYDGYSQKKSFGQTNNAGTGSFGETKKAETGGFGETNKQKTWDFGKTGCPVTPDYKVGDRVKQGRFGTGTVLQITKEKNDYVVCVNFDRFGEKRMLAGFAKIEKI